MSESTFCTKFNTLKEVFKSGKALITNVVFKNPNEQVINRIFSGDQLIVEVYIQLKMDFISLDVGIGFYDQNGNPQIHCATETIQKKYKTNSDFFIAKLVIDKWPLTENDYYLNLYLRSGGELLHHVEQAIWIKGVQGDYYGTGKLPSWRKGYFCE